MTDKISKLWYKKTSTQVLEKLKTDLKNGLNHNDISNRQEKYGLNIFQKGEKETFLGRILKQFKSPLVIILLIAAILTVFLQEYLDTTVIVIALSINIVIGVFQEKRASMAFEKLQQSQEKHATVIRGGYKTIIPAQDLVPGDIISVTSGSYIPADARIIEYYNLAVNESTLTGEWISVPKNNSDIKKETPITGRINMIYMGTLVTSGHALAVVVNTGNNTQIGSIAESLATTEESITPLQKSIKRLAHFLAYFLLASIFLILALGIFRGEPLSQMILVAIALAVAVMPEGLPAAVTVVLALGMESILKKKGLVRNLLATETLGSTTIIMTDKTGTLTEAKMRVYSIIASTSFNVEDNPENLIRNEEERFTLESAVLSLSAFAEKKGEEGETAVTRGRPLEKALLSAGLASGMGQEILLEKNPRLDLLPFEAALRFGASLSKLDNDLNRMYISGAPESILNRSAFVYKDGKVVKMTEEIRKEFIREQEKRSDQGMYMAATAYKDVSVKQFPSKVDPKDELFDSLVFCGIIALNDPIREDVGESIKTAQGAGVRVIMATGDNLNTAIQVAKQVGIQENGHRAVIGSQVDKMTDDELFENLKVNSVFARVLPEQKLRIVKILKNSGEVVAMTGDGVNDAPALKFADIGVALGDGTEVAKEASDIILLNNSFSIIVMAIGEGRRMLDNLKKVVAYLLSTNFSEIFVIGGALLVGAPLPLLPTQILWTNIVEEGFMNFAFAFEPKEKDVMKRDPRSQSMKTILSKNLKKLILIMSAVTGVSLTALYFFLLSLDMPIEEIRTIMFVVLSLDSIFFTFSLKNLHRPIWEINIFSNKYLIFSFGLSLLMLLLAVTFAPLQKLLSIVPLSGIDIPIVVAIGLFNLIAIEIAKLFLFKRAN